MKPIIIFGAGKIADIVYFCFKEYSEREIVCFCVDKDFLNSNTFNGLPVITSDQLLNNYTPDEYDVFVAVGYQNMNKFREEKCALFLSLGYTLASYIDPNSNIPKNFNIRFNSFLMSNILIHPFVDIGNNVFVWSG